MHVAASHTPLPLPLVEAGERAWDCPVTLPLSLALLIVLSAALLLLLRLRREAKSKAKAKAEAIRGETTSTAAAAVATLLQASAEILQDHCHNQQAMVEDSRQATTADCCLQRAQQLVSTAIANANSATGFPGRWKSIGSKLERLPSSLSNLSAHPCFAKNSLSTELLQSTCAALQDTVRLAGLDPIGLGKLQMQNDLDALSCRLDQILLDCSLLVKTGVLADESSPCTVVIAHLQIGHAEAKHRAVDDLIELMKEDEKSVIASLGRSGVSALVQLLTGAASGKIREKIAALLCLLVESGGCEDLLATVPPLIRLAETGTAIARERAVIALLRLSITDNTARSIVAHKGIGVLAEICRTGDSISQSAAVGALKNISAVPEVRQALAEEGVIRVVISLLDGESVLNCKEYAAECLQNLTAGSVELRRLVVSAGSFRSLLAYLDSPSPQEPAVGAVRNLVCSVSADRLVSLGLLPRLVHVLKAGSTGAQQAAASTVCKISSSPEMKRLVGESGCIALLVRMLEAKTNGAREAAAQAIAALASCPHNRREIKRDEKSVPGLVQLLDPSPQNTAKKYAVSCLLHLSSSKKCRRMLVSYGAIGYLKKLSEMEVPGAKKLLERSERGKLRSLFSRR